MENVFKWQKMISIQQEIYYIICIIKNIINSLVEIYQDKQITNILQQTNFTGKLQDDGATFFITEKQHKTIPNYSLDSLIVTK